MRTKEAVSYTATDTNCHTHIRCHRDESPPGDITAESTASVRINTQLLTSDSPSELCHTSSPSRFNSSSYSSPLFSISPLTLSFMLFLSLLSFLFFPPASTFSPFPFAAPFFRPAFYFLSPPVKNAHHSFLSPPPSSPPLTAVVDVHVVQSYLGGSVPAVQLLRVEPGLSSLLPQLDPADITTAVKHHTVQTP